MPTAPVTASLAERLDAVERLVQLFKVERIVHLAVTSISLAMLLFSAGILIYRSGGDVKGEMTVLTALFGSSGLITYSAGRLLTMWNQALQVMQLSKSAQSDEP